MLAGTSSPSRRCWSPSDWCFTPFRPRIRGATLGPGHDTMVGTHPHRDRGGLRAHRPGEPPLPGCGWVAHAAVDRRVLLGCDDGGDGVLHGRGARQRVGHALSHGTWCASDRTTPVRRVQPVVDRLWVARESVVPGGPHRRGDPRGPRPDDRDAAPCCVVRAHCRGVVMGPRRRLRYRTLRPRATHLPRTCRVPVARILRPQSIHEPLGTTAPNE